MSPKASSVFKFGIKAGSIVAGILKGGGPAAVAQRAFTYFAMANSGVAAYDAWRQSKNLQEQSTTSRQQGTQINSTASESALPIIYGLVRTGLRVIDIRQKVIGSDADAPYTISVTGAICVSAGGGNATAERGIQGVGYVYFDEDEAIDGASMTANNSSGNPTTTGMSNSRWWNGTSSTWGTNYFLRYMIHGGNQTAVDYYLNNQHSSTLTATGAWGTQTIGQGVAYATFWMFYNSTAYPNGLPNITMTVSGNRVPNVDDLTSAQAYSTNPARCIYDYMTSKTYGMGIPGREMDIASFQAADTYCDTTPTITLTTGSVTQKRYTCNGLLNSDESVLANLEKLLTSCNGRIVYENGLYSLKLRKVTSAETFELNETNIVGDWNFQRSGIDETPNSIKATYIDVNQNYQSQTITWPYPGDANPYLVEDGGLLNEMSVELPFTNDEYMAATICSEILKETRLDITCTLTAQREALKLTVGSVVKVTHSTPNWDEKLFWVESIAVRGDGLVSLALKEYADATYTIPTLKNRVTLVASNLPKQYADGSTEAPTTGPF